MKRHEPEPRTIWLSGITLRAVVLYLPWSLVAARASMLPLLLVIAAVIEIICALLYRRARAGGSGRALLLLSYLGVGDFVWFLATVAIALLSTIMPAWGYAAMVVTWLCAVAVNGYIVLRLPPPEPAGTVGALIARASLANSARHVRLRRLDRLISIQLASALVGLGLLGLLVTYILGKESGLLLSLAVMFLGLSCGFSAQIRPLWMSARLPKS